MSDTAAKHANADRSGPLLASLFGEAAGGDGGAFRVAARRIVGDDVHDIQHVIREWADEAGSDATEAGSSRSAPVAGKDANHLGGGVDLIVCTGGTGLGVRDVTPEALAPLLDKPTIGLTQALIQHSLSKTPMAALSRLTSGIRHRRRNPATIAPVEAPSAGSCLIVALPGSMNAVKECCDILLGTEGLLTHALELVSGGSGSVQHEKMQGGHKKHSHMSGTETDTGSARVSGDHHHSHGHSHGHHNHGVHSHHAPTPRTAQVDNAGGFKTHDPDKAVSLRHRTSPYAIISMDEALSTILDATETNPSISLPTSAELRGSVLAEDVKAPRSLPPRSTTNVDGYALKANTTPPGSYQVVTRVSELPSVTVCRINTGQALPQGADAVLMVEDTELLEETAEGEEKTIRVKAQVDEGENVRKAGSDVREGTVVLTRGTRISDLGGEIGTLAFLGHQEVRVVRKPRIAILSTGNELYDISRGSSDPSDAWGFRVFDANRPSLIAALHGAGLEVVDLGIVDDSSERTLAALNRGIEEADIVVSTGGTSMGESDLLKPLIERHVKGGQIRFGRVAMKPGKVKELETARIFLRNRARTDDSPAFPQPTTFATALSSDDQKRLIFALPGNPASALVCFYVFVLPAIRKLAGYTDRQCQLARVRVRLADAMRCDPRPEFHRAVVSVDQGGQLCAASTGSQRSR